MRELQKQSNQSLQDYLEQQEQTERESFTVTDDQQANWALRKIKQAQQKQEANNALALAEINKIEEWNKSENEKAQTDIDYFQGLLAGYALQKRNEDPKFKSLKLPNGRIRFTKQQPQWKYDDETVLQALKDAELNDFIQVTETPKKADIKKVFNVVGDSVINPDTGEIIEGITIEEREDKFGVVIDE